MRRVFLDTSYLKARIDRRDQLHAAAKAVSSRRGDFQRVTSEMVLAEFLNSCSERGSNIRQAALQTVDTLRAHRSVTVVPQTLELFAAALGLYRQRPDQGSSLTDCASMVIMEGEGIREVLSAERHFEQAGLQTLLRTAAQP
jgi:hypothetical protein